ncbi:MAG: hypothetical protein OES25_04200 [Acidobacteriota bacterium]|nr:hypothetical protein [Acidobacteriota bacterium]
MKRNVMTILALWVAIAVTPALAAGPIDGEIGAIWWANDFETTGGSTVVSGDAGAPGYRAEVWLFEDYGLRAGQYRSSLGDFSFDDAESVSVDFLWRVLSPTENNFLAVGAGWQDMDLATVGLAGDTSGARLTAEGRAAAAGFVYVYGQVSYLPSLADADATIITDGTFEDLSGIETEVGASFKLAPFVSLRAGYRSQTIDFTRTGFVPLPGQPTSVDGEIESSGFLAGLTVRF